LLSIVWETVVGIKFVLNAQVSSLQKHNISISLPCLTFYILLILGWHLCSNCEKNAHYLCYTCTFSLCKGCIKDAVMLCVRGNKGFCETCMRTVMLIEQNEEGNSMVYLMFLLPTPFLVKCFCYSKQLFDRCNMCVLSWWSVDPSTLLQLVEVAAIIGFFYIPVANFLFFLGVHILIMKHTWACIHGQVNLFSHIW
jgi:hypothetical protein